MGGVSLQSLAHVKVDETTTLTFLGTVSYVPRRRAE